jgi:hypothetical protein
MTQIARILADHRAFAAPIQPTYDVRVALPPPGVLAVRSADKEHVIAIYQPLAIAYFSRPPKDVELAVLRTLILEARADETEGGMLFVVARRNMSGGIDPRVRAFFEQTAREQSGHFGATATVVLMQGFGGAIMRSFLTGLILLTARRSQLRIFGSVEEACRWLAPQHGLSPEALLKIYAEATAGVGV